MFKNVASQKVELFAFDYATGGPKTGDAANLTAYVSKDHGVVTVLGDTSATEADSTNAKGVYLFDLTQAETNGDELSFTGKSTTGNVTIVPRFISTTAPNATLLSIDGSGRVDIAKVAGTAQTAGDLAAMITVVDDFVDTEITAIKAKTDNLPTDPADASDIAAAIAAVSAFVDTEVAAIKVKTDQLTFTGANRLDANVEAIHNDTAAAANLASNETCVGYGVVGTGSTTTQIVCSSIFPSPLTDSGQLNGRYLILKTSTSTAALQGQATSITGSTTGSTPTLTVSALTRQPQSGDVFTIN